MCVIKENYSLKNHNTFGIDAKAKYFATFNSDIREKPVFHDY